MPRPIVRIKSKNIAEGISGSLRLLCLALVLIGFSCKSPDKVNENKPISSIVEYQELRKEKLNRPRLIHNNDGGDATVFPLKKRNFATGVEYQPRPHQDSVEFDYEFSIKNFLDLRSGGLVGSDVSTISYCTSRAFSQFTHHTKIGECMTKGYDSPGRLNIIPELIKLDTDPLELTATFAHENGLEFFWSHRVNDTHDAGHRTDNPFPRWAKFKQENPHFLMGTIEERVPARWSSVDFKHREIRDLTIQYITEVCEDYDLDGIELDFFRHLFLFANVARHEGVATREQIDMITDMVARIREMTEKVGMEKGKPILVAVRVPDSIEYCEGVGIDLQEWMERGLVDIVIGSGYFRLNPWNHMVNAAHNNSVRFYAGFDESRIREGQHSCLDRSQNAVFRARAAAAWQAGVDGISVFNEYNTRAGYLSEIGEADKLNNTNNLYFINYRGTPGTSLSSPDFYLKNGVQYFKLPLVNPVNPVRLVREPLEFSIEIGKESGPAEVFVLLYATGVKGGELEVSVNNSAGSYKNGTEDGLLVFKVPQNAISPGINKITINNKGKIAGERNLLDVALLFYRNSGDPELKELAGLCL